jgi:hypothetical protein
LITEKRIIGRGILVWLAAISLQAAAQQPPGAPSTLPTDGNLPKLGEFSLAPGQEINSRKQAPPPKLMTPGLERAVQAGWRLPLVEAQHVTLPHRYQEATRTYASRVRLTESGKALDGYVAGRPFPQIDPNDPSAAYKIMWNYYYSFAITDDFDARNFEASTGSVSDGGPMKQDRGFLVDHYRKLNYNGRLYIDPHPELPNREGVRFKESIHPILEPYDMKGMGATFYRYLNPEKQDDSWLYLPQLRKVKRLSTAQRSDALFGQDTDVDSYAGYNGHIAWMDYAFMGERTVLGCMHAKNIPARWQQPENWLFQDVWEPRRVWVIEATTKLKQYAYGKRVLYIDKEAYLIPHSDIYDKNGELWKVWFNMFAIPDQGVSLDEDRFPFGAAAMMYDVQLSHATKTAIPSENTVARNQETIFINKGEKSGTNEQFFSIADLIASGK